jgi:hypothetical protein
MEKVKRKYTKKAKVEEVVVAKPVVEVKDIPPETGDCKHTMGFSLSIGHGGSPSLVVHKCKGCKAVL